MGLEQPAAGWVAGRTRQRVSTTVNLFPNGFTGVSVAALSIGAGTGAVFSSSDLWWNRRTFSAPNQILLEGTGFNSNYPITITASRPALDASTFQYQPHDITTTGGADYQSPTWGSWSVQFAPGAVQANSYLTVNGDSVDEPNELLDLMWTDNLCPAGGLIPGCSVSTVLSHITIVDDD